MTLDFGKILTRSWQIIWKHKVLWIFGILAGFASGRGSGNNNSRSNYNSDGSNTPFFGQDFGQIRVEFREFLQQYMLIIIAVCCVIFIVSLALYALGMMGRIGLIKGVSKVENGAESLAFGELWSESMPYFWRFFGLNFLIGLAVFIIIIPVVILAIATAGIALACLIPLICILVPVAWAVRIILEQAQIAIVEENLGMIDGFKRGWEIVKPNAVGIFIMALILGVAGFLIGIIIVLPVLLAVLPLFLSLGQLETSTAIPTGTWLTLGCCVIYFPVLLLLNGVLTAYIKTAWVLTYMQLTKPVENTPIVLKADA